MAIKLPANGAGDSEFASVGLLAPMDADFADVSDGGSTLVATNSPTITAGGKFGSFGDFEAADRVVYSSVSYGAGDFTVEAWIKRTAANFGTNSGAQVIEIPGVVMLGRSGTTSLTLHEDDFGDWASVGSAYTFSDQDWHHIALVRDGSTIRLYVDGTQISTMSFGGSNASSLQLGESNATFGGVFGIDDLRVTASARYPGGTSFTPPTAAHPTSAGSTGDIAALYLGSQAVSAAYLGGASVWSAGGGGGDAEFANVALLLSFDGSGTSYVDSSSNGVSVANSAYNGGGDTQSTAQAKFGVASLLVSASYAAAVEAPAAMPSGTQEFTLEFWHYSTQTSPYSRFLAGAGTIQAGTPGFELFDRSLEVNNTTLFSFAAPTNNVWQHVALVRQGNVFRLYRDGVELNNATSAATLVSGHNFYLGGQPYLGSDGFLAGHIDEVRLTLDVVRYPDGTTFTPPSEAFPVS